MQERNAGEWSHLTNPVDTVMASLFVRITIDGFDHLLAKDVKMRGRSSHDPFRSPPVCLWHDSDYCTQNTFKKRCAVERVVWDVLHTSDS